MILVDHATEYPSTMDRCVDWDNDVGVVVGCWTSARVGTIEGVCVIRGEDGRRWVRGFGWGLGWASR